MDEDARAAVNFRDRVTISLTGAVLISGRAQFSGPLIIVVTEIEINHARNY
jgi:hypothetical protein